MTSPAGDPINAVRGFGDFLIRLLREDRPSHVLVAFDGSLTTSFRNEIYPAYKSSREAPDEALMRQLEACYRVTQALGLTSAIDGRYEADDILAAARHRFESDFDRFVVVTADKDLAQLVDKRTDFYDFAKGTRLGVSEVKDRFGVEPSQIRDFLGLAGDSVDDIPGVRGVGPKTAVALLAEFRDLEDLYGNLDRVAGLAFRGAKTMAPKLEEHKSMAFLSRDLATCSIEAPVDFDAKGLARGPVDQELMQSLADELGLNHFLRSLEES